MALWTFTQQTWVSVPPAPILVVSGRASVYYLKSIILHTDMSKPLFVKDEVYNDKGFMIL